VPLKLSGQELQAESYAIARMNAIIHDMEVDLQRGDTMINPKFRSADGRIKTQDLVVANPMWNQPFSTDIFANDPFDRFRPTGGITTGKGDWAWLQHAFACMNENGRAAVVLDTGAVTRGSGSKHEDKERNIRKWFVDNDLVEGIVLLPDNLFYNTTAAGIIVVLNKRKPPARRDKIVLLNASKRFKKGRPKNYLPEEDTRSIAEMFNKAEPVDGEIAVITCDQAKEADYNLSPSRWVNGAEQCDAFDLAHLVHELGLLSQEARGVDDRLLELLKPLAVE
jgi:type I restriction enzyme M protein